MHYKSFLLACFTCLPIAFLSAQTSKHMKLYLTATGVERQNTFDIRTPGRRDDTITTGYNVVTEAYRQTGPGLQLAYGREKGKKLREYGMQCSVPHWKEYRLSIDSTLSNAGRYRDMKASIRAEFGRKRCVESKKDVTPYFSWYYALAWQRAEFEAHHADFYDQVNSDIAFRFGFSPRVHIKVSKHWFLDLNAAVNVLSFSIQTRINEKPSYPKSLQKSTYSRSELDLTTTLRLGLGYRWGGVK